MREMKMSTITLSWILMTSAMISFYPLPVSGHGRLWEPPSRSTMWRRGFNTPKNYNDNQLFCGGLAHQKAQGYRCGVCGDPFDGPRDNEPGGIYATGTIARSYTQGQVINLQVQLTANHQGFFEFKICPTNSPNVNATQDCLNRHPLTLIQARSTKYPINFKGPRTVNMTAALPAHLTCTHCVIQWRYHAGNSWGTDSNRRSCVGCGYQEEFYGCADVRIKSSGGTNPNPSKSTPTTGTQSPGEPDTSERPSPTTATTTTPTPTPTTAPSPSGPVCQSTIGVPAYDWWCSINCPRNHCPPQLCTCSGSTHRLSCRAIGAFANVPNMGAWCDTNCALSNCPASMCHCLVV